MERVKRFTTIQEVEAELLAHAPYHMQAADYKLQRVRGLFAAIGNPEKKLRVIHVAGTSGKTSTTYYIRGLLEAAGKRTGMTVSPHITSVCERLQLGGKPISESEFVRYFNEFYPLIASFEPRPTYFELLTAFVYLVFAEEKVDYAVIEVGLGGRYDATNVAMRDDKVCVINSIGYDHTEILGDTLTLIAGEKAGIIQEDNVVFTVPQEIEVLPVFAAECEKKHAVMHVVRPHIEPESSIPPFQQHNFALALAAAEFVAERDGFELRDTENVMTSTQVPGRFEEYHIDGKIVLLDGAHNPQKLETLFAVLTQRKMQPATVVAAFSEAPEKKIAACVSLVEAFAAHTIFTSFAVRRDVTRKSAVLMDLPSFVEQPEVALQQALDRDEPYVIVTGSLYLVSVLRPYVQSRVASTR